MQQHIAEGHASFRRMVARASGRPRDLPDPLLSKTKP
jgi:hypothetical protein